MRKFEKKIKELGFEKGKLSQGLNKTIKEFDTLEEELKGMKAHLKEIENDEDKEDELNDLVSEIEDVEEKLNEFDDLLVYKVEEYKRLLPGYQAKLAKMEEGRKRKAAEREAQGGAPTPTPAPSPTPAPAPQPQPTPNPEPTPAPKVEEGAKLEEGEGKKEKSGTNWLLWGALGIAGIFIGVNLFKNKK